jgi:hypothetical protein
MGDRYTKIVLTVIAVALLSLAVEQAVGRAKAAGEVCGANPDHPCYVRIVNPCWGNGTCMLQ